MKITPELINQIMRLLSPLIQERVQQCYDRQKRLKYAKQRIAVEQYRKARKSKVLSNEARRYADAERACGRAINYHDALAAVQSRGAAS